MEFKRLSDVEVIAEPAESANVLIEENGVIKKAPKTAVGGTGGSSKVITYYYEYDINDEYYKLCLDGVEVQVPDMKAEWDAGSILRIRHDDYNYTGMVIGFEEKHTDDSIGLFCHYISNDGSINTLQHWN